jgi:hypothetical protein
VYYRQIVFPDLAWFAQSVLQQPQVTAAFRDHQASGSAAVQPMYQFQTITLRPRVAQRFNDTYINPTAPMNRHASRFVDDKQVIVFVDDQALNVIEMANGGRPGRQVLNRRNSNQITRNQFDLGFAPFAVNSDLTLADNPIDSGLGKPL